MKSLPSALVIFPAILEENRFDDTIEIFDEVKLTM